MSSTPEVSAHRGGTSTRARASTAVQYEAGKSPQSLKVMDMDMYIHTWSMYVCMMDLSPNVLGNVICDELVISSDRRAILIKG